MDEGGLQLALIAGGETLHLYLPREVHTVAGHALVDGFLCAPVDGQLLVGVVVREVVLLILGEGLALHCREVAAEALDVYAHALFGMGDDGCEAGAVGDADLHGTVLKIGFAVVVMSEIEFLGKHLVEKCPYGQFLLAPCGAFGDFELLSHTHISAPFSNFSRLYRPIDF